MNTSPEYYTPAAKELFEKKLADVNESLSKPLPSSTADLKDLLERVEDALRFVWLPHPESTTNLLVLPRKVLFTEELLQHPDHDIRMIYASCMNEITRLAVPDTPYEDQHMRKLFKLFLGALKELAYGAAESAERRGQWILPTNSARARRILLVMALMKTCLIVLDLEWDQMVIDMFQRFFDVIRPDHPVDVFWSMETIMTSMIDEATRIPVELVMILLSSIKLDKKDSLPIAWALGKTVVEKCTTRLRSHVREAVRANNLDVAAYAEVVSSLCQDVPDGANMVAEKAAETVKLVTAGSSHEEALNVGETSVEEVKDSIPEVNDGTHTILGGEDILDALICCEQIVQLKNDTTISQTHAAENSEAWRRPETGLQQETETVTSRRRSRKPNSLLRPEEGYAHPWAVGSQVSHKLSENVKRKKDLALPSGQGKADGSGSSSGKELDSINEASTHARVRSRKTESVVNQLRDQELPSRPIRPRKGKLLPSNIKKSGSGSNTRKRKRMRAAGPTIANLKQEEVSASSNDSEGKDEPLLQEHRGRRSIRGGNTSQDFVDKMEEPTLSEPAGDNHPESANPEREKESSRSGVEYGGELVNARIMVWWPMDKTFYTGTIVSYDPALKKHKVIYDDDEQEELNLEKERWELFNKDHPRQVQQPPEAVTNPSPANQQPAAARMHKNETGRRGGSSRKEATSSSKWSRNEGCSAVKIEGRLNNDSGDESSDSYFS